MMRQSATAMLFAAMLLGAGSALAQAIPPGQSCGGLLCDMGVLGHKVAPGPNGEPPTPDQVAAAETSDPHRLPCNDFLCRAFGQRQADAAPPPTPAAAPAPVVEPAKPTKPAKKHKRLAKVEAAPADTK